MFYGTAQYEISVNVKKIFFLKNYFFSEKFISSSTRALYITLDRGEGIIEKGQEGKHKELLDWQYIFSLLQMWYTCMNYGAC